MSNLNSVSVSVILLIFSFFIVSCGGGSSSSGGSGTGDSGSPAPNISGDLNVQFSGEEGGVSRAEVSGNTIHYLNAIGGEPITNRSSVVWSGTRSYRWSNDRTGELSFRDGNIEFYESTDNVSNTYVILSRYYAGDSESHPIAVDFEVGGQNVSNIPSGLYRYNGYGASFPRHNSSTEWGDFIMNVDFDNARGTISYLEWDELVSLDGSFIINMQNGLLAGNNLRMIVIDPINSKNFEDNATIYGSFHNRGATGVSGVFYNNTDKVYGGVIYGARTDLRPEE